MTFEDGLYSLDTINFKVSLFTSLLSNGDDPSLITFFGDESTNKVYVYFNKTYVTLDATATDSILLSLGYTTDQGDDQDGKIGNFTDTTQFGISKNKAQLNPIQNYLLTTNISTGSYYDSAVSNILEFIPIGKTQAGSLSEYDANQKNYTDVNVKRIDRLTVTLLDNYARDIDMATSNGTKEPELWSVLISITEKK